MIQSWKRILVLGVLVTAGLGAAGFLAAPQRTSSQIGPVQLAPTAEAKASPPILVEQHFELLKEVGRPRGLAPHVRHVYLVDLKAGQLLRAIVLQAGVDVHLDLLDPSGAPLLTIDTPNGTEGEEPTLFVARWPGRYKLLISTETGPRADRTYVIKVAEVRRATSWDRRQASALQSYYEAKDLGRNGEKDPAKLLGAFEGATRSLEKAGATRELRAYAWQDLGIVCARQKRWQEGIKANRNAEVLFHRLGRKGREATVLIEIGRAEYELLDVERALKHFEKARALAQAIGDEKEEASASVHLGLHYAERADAWNATLHLERAASLREKSRDYDGESLALNGLGLLHRRLGENEKALKIFEGEIQRLSLKPSSRAVVLTQIGDTYINIGRPETAFQYYQQAYDLQKPSYDPDNQANTLVGFGLAYTGMRAFRNALDSYRKALNIYQSQKNLPSQAISFMNIGWALGSLQRYEEAKDSFGHALSLAHRLKNQVLEGGALLGFAWTERLRGDLSGAQRQAEEALKRVESTRRGIADQELRISYASETQDFYDFLIHTLLDQYDLQKSRDLLERALQVSESARSRGLLDTLGERAAARISPVMTVREIQRRMIDPDTILLEYELGRPKSYLFLVTSSDIKRFDLPPKEELEALARETYTALEQSRFSGERSQAIQRAAELSRILIGPAAGQLGDKRLLIVPSGALQLIPFGILPDPTASVSMTDPDLVWPEPLLRRHEITYEPSASVLAGIRRVRAGRRPASGLLAALADAVFDRDDRRIPGPHPKRSGGSDPVLGHLDRLPASEQEVEAITAGLPAGRIFKALGFSATRDLVMSGKLRGYGVLHIATHTYHSSEHPELSVLVLSRFDSKGRPRNGLLRIKDVSSLDLRSDLVVLSSCSSALGKEVRGEGIVGLPWAFLSAGASEVVMSLWDVEDTSTSEFMQNFYKIMSQGALSSRALREAQIQMWSEGKPPWFWAGFIAQGEWNIRPFLLNKTPSAVSSQNGDLRSPAMTKAFPPPPSRR